jgi:uncharacterized cupredoxin-like copper-binding protein
MTLSRRNWLTLATALLAVASAGPSFAASKTIKVSLWDKGPNSMSMLGKGEPMGMGMAGGMGAGHMGDGMQKGPMGITLSTHTVAAGDVTFTVTNISKSMVHEMVISPYKDAKTPLPYDKAGMKIDEDAAGHLGEVAELEAGKKGALTLTMKPGQYILYCNIPGHYVLGMWTLLTVK